MLGFTCGMWDPAPWSGIEPRPPALGAQSLSHWTTREVPSLTSLNFIFLICDSTLAWKIPWAEEPGRLQSIGSLRVGHDWATSLSLFFPFFFHFHFSLSCIGEGNGNPLQCSCLENPRDGGAWWPAVYGVSQRGTRLKRLNLVDLTWLNRT